MKPSMRVTTKESQSSGEFEWTSEPIVFTSYLTRTTNKQWRLFNWTSALVEHDCYLSPLISLFLKKKRIKQQVTISKVRSRPANQRGRMLLQHFILMFLIFCSELHDIDQGQAHIYQIIFENLAQFDSVPLNSAICIETRSLVAEPQFACFLSKPSCCWYLVGGGRQGAGPPGRGGGFVDPSSSFVSFLFILLEDLVEFLLSLSVGFFFFDFLFRLLVEDFGSIDQQLAPTTWFKIN